MSKDVGITIEGVRMRLANDMDFRLYKDICNPTNEWAAEHLTPEMILNGPPAELRRLVDEAARKIEHFGFAYTSMGLLIRDDKDVLDTEPAHIVAEAENLCLQLLQRIKK